MSELIDNLAQRAFDSGATDLFLCEDRPPRMRIDGEVSVSGDPAIGFATLDTFWKRCGTNPEVRLHHDDCRCKRLQWGTQGKFLSFTTITTITYF